MLPEVFVHDLHVPTLTPASGATSTGGTPVSLALKHTRSIFYQVPRLWVTCVKDTGAGGASLRSSSSLLFKVLFWCSHPVFGYQVPSDNELDVFQRFVAP